MSFGLGCLSVLRPSEIQICLFIGSVVLEVFRESSEKSQQFEGYKFQDGWLLIGDVAA